MSHCIQIMCAGVMQIFSQRLNHSRKSIALALLLSAGQCAVRALCMASERFQARPQRDFPTHASDPSQQALCMYTWAGLD